MPTKKKKNLLVDHPAWTERLSKEWDWEKNDEMGMRPDEVAAGSHTKAAWKCAKGHEWEAVIGSRTRGIGCPICAGKQVLAGYNDLATTNKELSEEWHPTKNDPLTPQDVTQFSGQKVWWLGKCGHEWEAMIASRSGGQGCPVCAGRQVLIGFNDLTTVNRELSEEWHPTKNDPLTPQDVTAGSSKTVWWLGKCGHEWEAAVHKRSTGRGCPVCVGQLIQPGTNDLATVNRELSEEWHPTKNDPLTPQDVTAGSSKTVWWLGQCGHEWKAVIGSRTRGIGCPICAGKQVLAGYNDLATTNKELSEEWHPTKNDPLTPQDVTQFAGQKVWWLGKCGHEWEATVANRASGWNCPVCAGKQVLAGYNDLATTNKELSEEWHPTKNDPLTPEDVTAGTSQKAWWLGKCGHEWEATVASRVYGAGCPVCAGKQALAGYNDLATTNKELSEEWHTEKNWPLTPSDVVPGSVKQAWWRCPKCGNEWKTGIRNRVRGHGCPKCASSHGEKDAVSWAISQDFVVDEQWRHPDCRDQKTLPFDLMLYVPAGNALMEVSAVEYDGEHHSNPDTYFNQKALLSGRGGISYVQRHDAMKTSFCMATHRVLIRVPHTVVDVEAIGEFITEKLRENGLGWALQSTDSAVS